MTETRTPADLQGLMKRVSETFDPGGSLDVDGPDEWVKPHLDAMEELEAALRPIAPPPQEGE